MRPPLKITFLGIRITIGWDKLTPWLITLINGLYWDRLRKEAADKYGDIGGQVVDEAKAWIITQVGG